MRHAHADDDEVEVDTIQGTTSPGNVSVRSAAAPHLRGKYRSLALRPAAGLTQNPATKPPDAPEFRQHLRHAGPGRAHVEGIGQGTAAGHESLDGIEAESDSESTGEGMMGAEISALPETQNRQAAPIQCRVRFVLIFLKFPDFY